MKCRLTDEKTLRNSRENCRISTTALLGINRAKWIRNWSEISLAREKNTSAAVECTEKLKWLMISSVSAREESSDSRWLSRKAQVTGELRIKVARHAVERPAAMSSASENWNTSVEDFEIASVVGGSVSMVTSTSVSLTVKSHDLTTFSLRLRLFFEVDFWGAIRTEKMLLIPIGWLNQCETSRLQVPLRPLLEPALYIISKPRSLKAWKP